MNNMLFRAAITSTLLILLCAFRCLSQDTPADFYFFDVENYEQFSCNIEPNTLTKILKSVHKESLNPLLLINIEENFADYRFTYKKGGELTFSPTSINISIEPRPLPDQITSGGKVRTKEELEKAQSLYLQILEVWQKTVPKKYDTVRKFTESMIEDIFYSLEYEYLSKSNNTENIPYPKMPLYTKYDTAVTNKFFKKQKNGSVLKKIDSTSKKNGAIDFQDITIIEYKSINNIVVPIHFSKSISNQGPAEDKNKMTVDFTNCTIE
jgi:hypothetical protein